MATQRAYHRSARYGRPQFICPWCNVGFWNLYNERCPACLGVFHTTRTNSVSPKFPRLDARKADQVAAERGWAYAIGVTDAYRDKRAVQVDATWSEGTAWLAVTGALGRHVKRVESSNNVLAEAQAVLYAMEIALANVKPPSLRFRTDCQALAVEPRKRRDEDDFMRAYNRIYRLLACFQQWRLEYVHRSYVQDAHRLAGKARVGRVAER